MGVYSLSKSSVNNWVKYSNAAAGNGQTSDFELIGSILLTSQQTSVAFNLTDAHRATYKHLQLRYVARSARATVEDGNIQMYFNGDTSANYRSHYLVGTGSSAVSYDNGTNLGLGSHPGASAAADQYLPAIVDIVDAFSTSKNKTVKIFAGSAGSVNSARVASGVWFNANALSNIQMTVPGSFWQPNSRFSLYGVK